MTEPKRFPRRRSVAVLFALSALSTACRQPVGIVDADPSAPEIPVRATGVPRAAVASGYTVDAMTIETRFWDSAPWIVIVGDSSKWKTTPPVGAAARSYFESLPRTVPGYTNAPIELPTLKCNTIEPGNAGAPPDYFDLRLPHYSGCVRNPAGAHTNLAVRYRARISASKNTNLAVRFAIDAAGGVLMVDGAVVKELWTDPFWNGFFDIDNGDVGPDGVTYVPKIETDTSSVLTTTFTLRANTTHVIEVIGFENAADFGASAQFNDGAGWVDAITMVPPYRVPLTVGLGTGGGRVVSSPAGIDCGTTCTATFAWATMPTLTPTADQYFAFAGWSGACTGTAGCAPLVETPKSVTATFTRVQWPLQLLFAGAGSGTVTSADGSLSCTAACGGAFAVGSTVQLSAMPAANSVFAGWSGGGCAGTGTCSVPMNQLQSVTATFALKTFALTVSKAGDGTGTVTSAPTGLSCGTACTATYPIGTQVTLTATPATSADFTGWSGGCSGVGPCIVTMSQAQAVTATFTRRVTADTDPPVLSCTATPAELWPVNHKMRDIRIDVSAVDQVSGPVAFTLLSVVSNEPSDGKGDGKTVSDIEGWKVNTPDVTGELRAERNGTLRDRVYTFTYGATDNAGNSATTTCAVVVPHDQRK